MVALQFRRTGCPTSPTRTIENLDTMEVLAKEKGQLDRVTTKRNLTPARTRQKCPMTLMPP